MTDRPVFMRDFVCHWKLTCSLDLHIDTYFVTDQTLTISIRLMNPCPLRTKL